MLQSRFALCASCAAALLTAGCAYTAHPVAIAQPDMMPAQAQYQQVEVGADGYFTAGEAESAFDVDVTRVGYLPVLVSVWNKSSEAIRIRTAEARLVSSDGKIARPYSWARMHSSFSESVAGAAIGGGLIGAEAAADKNDAMAVDWQTKALPAEPSLSKDETAGGFIYFWLDKNEMGEPPYQLTLPFERLPSGLGFSIDLKLLE